jgi:ATP-dependent Clp protease ATP-binding subunit ClpC
MVEEVKLDSLRAYEARLGKKIGKKGFQGLVCLAVVFAVLAIILTWLEGLRYGLILISPTLLFLVPALWWQRHLSVLPPKGNNLNDRLSKDVLANLNPKDKVNVKTMWAAVSDSWQSKFLMHHLLILPDTVNEQLKELDESALKPALEIAVKIADAVKSNSIEPSFITAGLMLSSPKIKNLLISYRSRPEEIMEVGLWLGRNMVEFKERNKQNFGGIGRDWAFGYTPLLNKFGANISLSIMRNGAHFGWLTESKTVIAIESALANHANAIAVVGKVGVGKSSSVYALAQRLIEGKTVGSIAYHQVIAINATDIVSNTRKPGDTEYIMMSLANEASHAGHVVLFMDDAEAFFTEGTGSFDGAQILQSIIQSNNVSMILALTPNGYEAIRSRNPSLASLITPIMLPELDEINTMRVLEDTAIGLENKNKLMISYEALTTAYNLSGRYNNDEAYPGKAIKLLEQSLVYANDTVVSRKSVEQAIEQTHGVKAGAAGPVEVQELLKLESRIHERMINQNQAVSVVSNALRRARAGVSNPNKPVGSFLFLGPTGVGKTELAKALAATYFGAEENMIRLDMTEYQRPEDVKRLLSDGQNESASLILAVRQKPFSVVLLDEIEKAHPNVLNLLLQLVDEGHLTDSMGRIVSFKDCIIIVTSNAGAQSIRKDIELGKDINEFHNEIIDELIKTNQFKPELINRFDEVVIFRPLKPEELTEVVKLMLSGVNKTLAQQNIVVSLTDASIAKIVEIGYDPTFGARPMRRALQKAVEDTIANKILKQEVNPGDHIELDVPDLTL